MTAGTAPRRRIGLLVVPGTIDALLIPGSRRQPGMDPAARVAAHEMVAAIESDVPDLDIAVLPGPERLSHDLTAGEWLTVARTIQDALAHDSFDGIVVTHGTNNLEEFAYFLSLTLRSDKPVVVTGAMLAWNRLGTDGPFNLIQALYVAACEASRSRGVLIAFGREVFGPRTATKVSTVALSAFAAPGAGPLGRLDADRILRYEEAPLPPPAVVPVRELAALGRLPRVDVIASYVGADAALVEACVAAGAAGLVTAAGGGGVTTTAELEALRSAAARGVVVCQASRVPGGVVHLTRERLDDGFVAAGTLSPWKARILLMLALTQTRDLDRIRGLFASC
jgi:L-asparaginase